MYLQKRSRILRSSPAVRSLVAETQLKTSDFIAPLFIDEGKGIRQ
ncbi:MAG TPA: porphobilinogen synthase, partial [Puia sp.]|nr:porphobilinogen synthase [Puia sp.]